MRSTMTRKILTVLTMLAVLGPVAAITGCNTMAGAGQDIERGGQSIEGAARDVQRKI